PIYYDLNDNKKSMLESGATLTISLLIKNDDNSYHLYTSHVGDTKVMLYRPSNGNLIKKVLTDEHSTNNKNDIERVKKHGLQASGRYFIPVLNSERGLMPSRSIGHPYLSNFGISEYPFISAEELYKNDVVIFASDGLWDLNNNSEEMIDNIMLKNHN